MKEKKKYFVTVRYPCDVDQNARVDFVDVYAKSPEDAQRLARLKCVHRISVPRVQEYGQIGEEPKEFYFYD